MQSVIGGTASSRKTKYSTVVTATPTNRLTSSRQRTLLESGQFPLNKDKVKLERQVAMIVTDLKVGIDFYRQWPSNGKYSNRSTMSLSERTRGLTGIGSLRRSTFGYPLP